METDFATYVAERRPVLLRAARAITGDPHTGEDLLQSVLASVCPRWGFLRDQGAADAYVRRALANRYASWHRQPWRRNEWPVERLPEPHDHAWPEEPGAGRALWPLVEALPPRQRATVVLRYYEQLSEAETARVLGCSLGTVKSNTSRGLAALRRSVEAGSLEPVG